MDDRISATAGQNFVEPEAAPARAARFPRHIIEAVSPVLNCGRFPVKRIVGDSFMVEADVFRDGHEVIRAAVLWRRYSDPAFSEVRMVAIGNDRWRAEFPLD